MLGNAVAKLRTKFRKDLVSVSMLEELERMDFALNVTQFKWDRIVLPSLRQFYKEHGHLDIPQKIVVPEDKAWPMLAWGRRIEATAPILDPERQSALGINLSFIIKTLFIETNFFDDNEDKILSFRQKIPGLRKCGVFI
ncbi:hypothetical protein PHMEG_00021278 [Phytophthora megakarya]|uniref:Uncharacterized protein n=1 Tax=Phytophthora megakarya TaxID=4795 RepID=A0A225VPI8_9STRA|nr:hypothetical protein PHMEG_00021278 [Phytophthora megakarya]